MPRYDYECGKGHVREVEHGMNDCPEVLCRRCGFRMKKRITLAVAFVVPAYMSAGRSDAADRQAVYLKSDRHKKNRQKDAKIAERQEKSVSSKDSFLKSAQPLLEQAKALDTPANPKVWKGELAATVEKRNGKPEIVLKKSTPPPAPKGVRVA